MSKKLEVLEEKKKQRLFDTKLEVPGTKKDEEKEKDDRQIEANKEKPESNKDTEKFVRFCKKHKAENKTWRFESYRSGSNFLQELKEIRPEKLDKALLPSYYRRVANAQVKFGLGLSVRRFLGRFSRLLNEDNKALKPELLHARVKDSKEFKLLSIRDFESAEKVFRTALQRLMVGKTFSKSGSQKAGKD